MNRHMILKSTSEYVDFKEHKWYLSRLPWLAGEWDIYSPINESPSEYLKNYMLEEYRFEWCDKEKWWISTDAAKYNAAKKKQKEQKPVTNNNIVTVNFKKEG